MDSVKDVSENDKSNKRQNDKSFRTRILVADIFEANTVFFAFKESCISPTFVCFVLCVAAWDYWRVLNRYNSPSWQISSSHGTVSGDSRSFWGWNT